MLSKESVDEVFMHYLPKRVLFIFNSPRKVEKTIYNNSTQCTAVTRQLAKNSQRCS